MFSNNLNGKSHTINKPGIQGGKFAGGAGMPGINNALDSLSFNNSLAI
jgi:hypothetical protein